MSGRRIYGASDDLVELVGVCDLVTRCPTCGHEYEMSIGWRVGEGFEEGIRIAAPDGTPVRWEVSR